MVMWFKFIIKFGNCFGSVFSLVLGFYRDFWMMLDVRL